MTSRTNRHLGGQPRGGTDDVTPSTLAQRRQLAVQRYLDGDRIETICREMGCAKSCHPAPSDVVARRSRNGERSRDPGSSQPSPSRIAPFASHALSHSQPSAEERGFTVRYIIKARCVRLSREAVAGSGPSTCPRGTTAQAPMTFGWEPRLFDFHLPGAALSDPGYPPSNRLRPSARRHA